MLNSVGSGVRNLRSLATAVTQQKLSYEFPYSSFDLDTDLNFVLVSEGKAILPVRVPPLLFSALRADRDRAPPRRIAWCMFARPRTEHLKKRSSRTRASWTSSAATSRP